MVKCGKCKKEFRDNFNLTKHQSRMNQCVGEIVSEITPKMSMEGLNIPNSLIDIPNQSLDIPNQSLDIPNQSLDIPNQSLCEENTCKFCLHTFSSISNKIKHKKFCKYRDDPIRLLEIENDIIPELPESKTECRFCNKIYHNTSNLNKHINTCKEREVYKQILIKEKSQITINNNCNNVNCNNINFVLNFGQTNDTTKIEEIIDCLRAITKEYKNNPEQIYLMAGDLINRYDNLLLKAPENNNLIIPDSKCLYAEVKIPGGWEKESVDNSLNRSFKDRANKISEKKEEINDTNERVFKSTTNQKIFSEVKQFANKGFFHSYRGEELRKVKTNYKINKLKKKVLVVDF